MVAYWYSCTITGASFSRSNASTTSGEDAHSAATSRKELVIISLCFLIFDGPGCSSDCLYAAFVLHGFES